MKHIHLRRLLLWAMHGAMLLFVVAGIAAWSCGRSGELVLTPESHPARSTDEGAVALCSPIYPEIIRPYGPDCILSTENGEMHRVAPNSPAILPGGTLAYLEECSEGYVKMLIVHNPVGLIIAWAACVVYIVSALVLLAGELFRRSRRISVGFMALTAVSVIGMAVLLQPSDPSMPVLRTPWLVLHLVPLIMAYSLMPAGIVVALIVLAGRYQQGGKLLRKIFIVMALLLGIGIATGAMWASLGWGRCWGWDLKEIWALIAYIIASVPLHFKLMKARALAVWLLVLVAAVAATYFSLNPFGLSSMHVY